MTEITLIPLNKLVLSDANARRDPGDVTKLAHSIQTHGLVTALTVAKAGRKYAVFAGGRRLAALNKLAADGIIGKGFEVPCVVFDDASTAASLAENVEREPMDVVQQFQAFARLLGDGQTVHQVAEAFSVTPQYVRQRARLAELVPEAIRAYREGRARLDQLEALTWGTPDQQRAICEAAHLPGAYELRQRLKGGTVPQTDRRVLFVGLDAYLAAGGATVEDLFANTTDLTDVALLERLVQDKVAAKIAAHLREGAAWAELSDNLWKQGYERCPTTYTPTPAQQRKIEAAEAELADISTAWEQDPDNDALGRAHGKALRALTQLREASQKRASDIPHGVLLYLQQDGTLLRSYVVKATDLRAWVRKQGGNNDTGGDVPPEDQAPKPNAPLPGTDDLTKTGTVEIAIARQTAIAAKLLASPAVASALLLQQLDCLLFGPAVYQSWDEEWFNRWDRPGPMHLSAERRKSGDHPAALDIARKRAWERRGPYRDMLAPPQCLPLTYYLEHADRTQILADCVAVMIQDPDSADGHAATPGTSRATIQALMQLLCIDLADWWSPSAAWLKGYGKAATIAALDATQLTDRATEQLGMPPAKAKAGDLYPIAAELLTAARWLPTYALAGVETAAGVANG